MPSKSTKPPDDTPGDTPDRSELEVARTLPPSEASDDQIITGAVSGTKLARYTVIKEIGSGAMGVVLLSYDPELDRRVALKVLRPEACGSERSEEARLRLKREAQALAKLSHPNVTIVHEVGSLARNQLFVAMEYVDGQTLRAWLRNQTPTRQEILEVFDQAGRGLAAAHKAGFVHRDFKPDNVLVGRDGRVRVTDFGLVGTSRDGGAVQQADPDDGTTALADTREVSVTLTQSDALVGTPSYMAPEQHTRSDVDARTDQFAFCVTLYEALYGERPFSGDTYWQVATNVMAGSVRDAPADSDVPQPLREVLLRGLSVNKEDRFPSMEALLDALSEYRAARVEAAAVKLSRRRWVLVALAALLVATGVVLTVLFSQTPSKTRAAQPATEPANALDEAQEMIRAGRVEAAIYVLEKRILETPDDGRAQLLLGHAYAAEGRAEDSVRAYDRALVLDESLASDAQLRQNLTGVLAERTSGLALDAADLLIAKYRDEAAIRLIGDVAATEADREMRLRALALATKHGVSDQIDLVSHYTLNLNDDSVDCAERKKAVHQLRALGGARAIKALRAGLRKPDSECLRDEAEEAIVHLEGSETP